MRSQEVPVELVNQDVGCTTGDICPSCGGDDLLPEHQHVKCPSCGYIGPCCW